VNIYRLYTFYREWEVNNFTVSSTDNRVGGKTFKTFSDILVQQNAIPVTLDSGAQSTSAATDALVKHSKILYMTSANIDRDANSVVNNQYWLGLIENSQNPKLISNSSPIPINLRTPNFDPNLSTQQYNNQPTYLFPYQYFNLTSFGYSGDDTDHSMGGKSWTIQADEYISLFSGAVSVGSANMASIFKTPAKRNFDYLNGSVRIATPYSFVWGYDTFARGAYSTAGGLSSVVPFGCDGAISIGYDNIASDQYSATVGGLLNSTSSTGGGIFAGSGNIVSGQFGGILAGVNNIVGGPVYDWKFGTTNAVSDCVFIEADCSTTNTNTLGRQVIYIDGNVTSAYLVGDVVRIFDFTTTSGNTTNNAYYMTNGDAWKSFTTTISGASSYDINTNLTTITVLDTIPYSTAIVGGRISLLERVVSGTTYKVGFASMALGESLIAMGAHQTVIGHNNRALLTPSFVIGSGYGNSIDSRANIVEVYDDNVIIYGTPSKQSGPTPPPMINYLNVNYIDYKYDEGFVGFQVNSQFIEATASTNRLHLDSGSFDLMAYINVNSKTSGLQYPDPLTIGGISLTNLGGAVRIGAYDYLDTFTPLNKYDVGVFATDDIFIETNKTLNVFSNGSAEFDTLGNFYITAAGDIVLDGNSVIIKNNNTGTDSTLSGAISNNMVDLLPKVIAINLDNAHGVDATSNFTQYINSFAISFGASYFEYYLDLNFNILQKLFGTTSADMGTAGPSSITIVLDKSVNLGTNTTGYMSTSRPPTSSISPVSGVAPARTAFNSAWYEVSMTGNNVVITKWSTYNMSSVYDVQYQMLFMTSADNKKNVTFNGMHNLGLSTSTSNTATIYPNTLSPSVVKIVAYTHWSGSGYETNFELTDAATINSIVSFSIGSIVPSQSASTGTANIILDYDALMAAGHLKIPTSNFDSIIDVRIYTSNTVLVSGTTYKLPKANVTGVVLKGSGSPTPTVTPSEIGGGTTTSHFKIASSSHTTPLNIVPTKYTIPGVPVSV